MASSWTAANQARRWTSTLGLALWLVMSPTLATAQTAEPAVAGDSDAQNRLMFNEAEAHYAAGRYRQAAGLFARVYDRTQKPQLLFNLANCYERMGEARTAAMYLRRYAEIPGVPGADLARERIGRLEARDEQRQRELQTMAQARDTSATGAATATPVDKGDTGPSRIGPIVVMSVGAAAIVAGVVTGVMALKARDDAKSACMTGDLCPASAKDDIDRQRSLAGTTDVLIGVGSAAVVGGVAWLVINHLTAKKAERATAWRLGASYDASAVSLAVGRAF
ncbi:MAG: hypothetical protein IPL40_06310 [Proteobacteria bacterium]|nr:hypothetical protein [Pseudomonadota bacterium]